jgi:hypothetical protein
VFVFRIKGLSRHLAGETGENYENAQSGYVFLLRFEADISKIQFCNFTVIANLLDRISEKHENVTQIRKHSFAITLCYHDDKI